jgi:hypothetical protein
MIKMNEKDQLLHSGTETIALFKEYLLLEAETTRLQFLKKIRKDLRTIVATMVVLFFVLSGTIALGVGIGLYLSVLLDSYALGALGSSVFFFILAGLFWWLKKKILF